MIPHQPNFFNPRKDCVFTVNICNSEDNVSVNKVVNGSQTHARLLSARCGTLVYLALILLGVQCALSARCTQLMQTSALTLDKGGSTHILYEATPCFPMISCYVYPHIFFFSHTHSNTVPHPCTTTSAR